MRVNISYDPNSDILFIRFYKDREQVDIEEVDDGIILYLDREKKIIGLEIWDAAKRGILSQFLFALGESFPLMVKRKEK